MIKFDVTKDVRQDESLIKWKLNKGIGCVNACPRFGKTKIGLKAIEKRRQYRPNSRIVVIVPSEIIENHWTQQDTTDIFEIYTSHKVKNNFKDLSEDPIDLLIVDELHKFTSDDNTSLLVSLSQISKFRLALTGTYPSDNKILSSWFPVIDTITEEEALDKNWISDFIEYNIPVPLTNKEKIQYAKFSKYISETLELFKNKYKSVNQGTNLLDGDLDLIYSCYLGKKHKGRYIPGDAFRELVAKLMGWDRNLDLSIPANRDRDIYWNPNNIYERCKEFKMFVSRRNEILINNENKLELLLYICKQNPVPTIIFNESTEFVNIIADKLGKQAIPYHSKIKSRPLFDEDGNIVKYKTGKVKMFGATRLKNEAIEGIKSGKYLYLVTVKSLDEGLDLPMLEQVIITAGSANPLQQLQRSARGKSINGEDSNKLTKIFNLYIDDYFDDFSQLIKSRDKSKLMERQKNYTHSVKWLNSINDITL